MDMLKYHEGESMDMLKYHEGESFVCSEIKLRNQWIDGK